MDSTPASTPQVSSGPAAKRVEPLELFFDLVFVFALTQVTTRLAADHAWSGLVRGLLIMGAVWWAWAAYAWLTNEVDSTRRAVRITVFAAMGAMLVTALSIPTAFEKDAWLFAGAYMVVRILHIVLFAAASDDVGVHRAVRAMTPTALGAPALLMAAAAFDGWVQIAIWMGALVVDYVGAGTRGIGGWRLSTGHFAERHALIVIIALGESIVAIGVGAAGLALDWREVAAALLGVAVSTGVWSCYFDRDVDAAEHALHARPAGRDRNTAARDGYSFLHLGIVTGIVLLALGVKTVLGHVGDNLTTIRSLALYGGAALFLVAHTAFRARVIGRVRPGRIVTATVLLAMIPLGRAVPSFVSLLVLTAVCAALVGAEVWPRRRTA